MNSTMAPIDHSSPLNDLKRRIYLEKHFSRRRDNGGGERDGNRNRNPDGNSISNPSYNDGGGDFDNENGYDDDLDPFQSPPIVPQSQAAQSTSIAQISAVTTIPATVVLYTAAASSSILSLSTTPTFISSFFPNTTSFIPLLTPFTSLTDTSSQPKKGLNTESSDSDSTTMQTTAVITSTGVTALAETAAASTASPSLEIPPKSKKHHDGSSGLSPPAEHFLIAFAAIGAFIIFVALIFFIARMKKIDLLSKARGRKFSRGGPRSLHRWREKESDHAINATPPKYGGRDESFEYSFERKALPARPNQETLLSPTAMPAVATLDSAAALSRINTQRQDTVREALLDNPAPFGVSPPTEQSATQAFHSQNLPNNPNSIDNASLTFNTNATARGLSRQTSDAHELAQREANRMSELSSLSSGFGDQIIIPEPGPSNPTNAARGLRQSYRQSRKFSWATSSGGTESDRDTVYTTNSIDSQPPRFRTVNSWVAQQTGRLQRQQQPRNDQIPSMPEIPEVLRIGVRVDHQRKQSEDLAFRYHPGDEIPISTGSRIPSTILDKKFGIK